MKRNPTTADHAARTARIAQVVCFVVPLALLATMGAAKPAHAAVIGGGPTIDTAIATGPASGSTIEDESPTFSFSATSDGNPFPGAVFHCAVDNQPVTICPTPFQLGPLEEGEHTLSVYAEDPGTLAADPSPASRSFTVDLPAPAEGECAGEECNAKETSPFPPDQCILRTARARVFAYTSHDKVRLVIRYTSLSPAEVKVDYWMKGKKGSLSLGQAKQRFARKGIFRLTEKLSDGQMGKVRAAKGFFVKMGIPGTPRYCNRYYSRRLTIKRTVQSQLVWFQSDSIFGTAH
jgi:hypothetical protein